MSTIILKRNLFRIIGVLIMGSVFLTSVFYRLPSPFHSATFYLFLWIMCLFFLDHKIFLSKSARLIYLFIVIYFISSVFFWSDRVGLKGEDITLSWIILKEIAWPMLGILMIKYFYTNKDYKGFAIVVVSALLFLGITSITSIIGFEIFEGATRQMASGETDDTFIYKSIGIGTYGFFTSIIFIVAPMAYLIKTNFTNTILKPFLILFVGVLLYSIVKSELTTSMVMAFVFFIMALILKGKDLYKILLFFIITAIVIMFLLNEVVADGLEYIAQEFLHERVLLQRRIYDLALTFRLGDYSPESEATYLTSERFARGQVSFESFLENPFIGGGENAGHAFWIDRLGLFGLLGIFPWILIFRNQINLNAKMVSMAYKPFYIMSFIAFIFFGLLKSGLSSPQTMIGFFVLAPGIYYIKYLFKKQPTDNRVLDRLN